MGTPRPSSLITTHANHCSAAAENAPSTAPQSAQPAKLARKKQAKRKKKIGEWSEEEHNLFLEGAEALGGDDWTGIANKYVKSRSARQVKCHALTYERTEEWNIDEHSRFLKGVKVAGRGEFTYIAKHFVKTRNAREVQEYADNHYAETEEKQNKDNA